MRDEFFSQRTCICCRGKKNKDELLRFVFVGGNTVLDNKKEQCGRGFYICNNEECLKKCVKKKLLNKIFKRQNINYSAIENLIKDG